MFNNLTSLSLDGSKNQAYRKEIKTRITKILHFKLINNHSAVYTFVANCRLCRLISHDIASDEFCKIISWLFRKAYYLPFHPDEIVIFKRGNMHT